MKLIHDADPCHVLVEGGKEIPGGKAFTVTQERAEELRADPYVNVRSPRRSDTEGQSAEKSSGSSGASS